MRQLAFIILILPALLLMAACGSTSPTAEKVNAYCDSGAEGSADVVADQVVSAANAYFRGRGGRFTIERVNIRCDETTS